MGLMNRLRPTVRIPGVGCVTMWWWNAWAVQDAIFVIQGRVMASTSETRHLLKMVVPADRESRRYLDAAMEKQITLNQIIQ